MTALLVASEPDAHEHISAIVLDSPFSNLWDLALELVESQNLGIPSVATSMARVLIRGSVKSRTGVEIDDLSPVKVVHKAKVPALFCAARGDTFVKPHHSLKLLNAYGGEKELRMIKGDHNSARPKSFLDVAIKFMVDSLHKGNISSLSPEKKRAKKQGNSTSPPLASDPPKIPQSSSSHSDTGKKTKKTKEKGGDIFNVKSMQNNLFQSHKERQYIEGMSINAVLKKQDDNEDDEDFEQFQTPDPSPRKISAKKSFERRRDCDDDDDDDVKPPSVPGSSST